MYRPMEEPNKQTHEYVTNPYDVTNINDWLLVNAAKNKATQNCHACSEN
jgi:hypothetical protein